MLTLLEEFAVFAITNEPAIAEDIKRLVELFKRGRPDLVSPPPADTEASLNASIDAAVRIRE